MKTTFIYTISDELGTIRYIGKSNNPKNRLYSHLQEKANLHKYNWLRLIVKRGFFPIVEIIDEVPVENWEIYEIYWISQFKAWGFNLLNLTEGGEGSGGYQHSDISKKKMRKSKLGTHLSQEHKDRISESVKLKAKESPNYNKCYDKSIFLDKDLLFQKYITENLSIPKLSIYFEVSEKTIFSNLKEFGIEKDKSIWRMQCAPNPKKIVLQYDLSGDLIKEWIGLDSIQDSLKINSANIANCCRGLAKTTGGFIWRYKDEWIDLKLDNLNSKKRKVEQYSLDGNFISQFNSIKEAFDKSNVNEGNIQSCCVNRYKSAGGFIWRYKQ